jgi:hypothetical protein
MDHFVEPDTPRSLGNVARSSRCTPDSVVDLCSPRIMVGRAGARIRAVTANTAAAAALAGAGT